MSRMADYRSRPSSRPDSANLVDLHVYIVPPDIWRDRFNNLLNQAVSETISIGIIRVPPDTKLIDIRDELIRQLEDLVPGDFIFLRSVGRSLTRLKSKQEYQLKAKHFLPPVAYAPELYLLEATADIRASLASDSSSRSHSYNHLPDRESQRGFNTYREGPYDDRYTQTKGGDPNTQKGGANNFNTPRENNRGTPSLRYTPLPRIESRSDSRTNSPSYDPYQNNPNNRHQNNPNNKNNPNSTHPYTNNKFYEEQPHSYERGTKPNELLAQTDAYHKAPPRRGNYDQSDDRDYNKTSPHSSEKPVPNESHTKGRYDPHSSPNTIRTNEDSGFAGLSPEDRERDTYLDDYERRKKELQQRLDREKAKHLQDQEERDRLERERREKEKNDRLREAEEDKRKREAERRRQEEQRKWDEEKQQLADDEQRKRDADDEQRKRDAERERERRRKEEEEKRKRDEENERRRKEEEEEEKRKREAERANEKKGRNNLTYRRRSGDDDDNNRKKGQTRRGPNDDKKKREDEERKRREAARKQGDGDDDREGRNGLRNGDDGRLRNGDDDGRNADRNRWSDKDDEDDDDGNSRRYRSVDDDNDRDTPSNRRRRRTGSEDDGFPSPPPLEMKSPREVRDTDSAYARRRDEKERLLAELDEARDGRRAAEQDREELVKRAKTLQHKTTNRRNNARDMWKKRYFEEKKRTSPLEDQTNRLRHELETIHRKLMSTLEGPKDGKQIKYIDGKPSPKNNYIIQCTRLQHEIEDLRRRAENAKMKLTAEMKLRNQADAELRALRAELTQKKINLTLSRNQQLAALSPGADLNEGPKEIVAQN
ncbi:hypothetical protein SNE40_011496 [Patella caerulea]|uniref:Spermatogenesis-associated protein 1 C-terminal domain-containing protein n=1 Tax=Patella caerulea TaxID=87958 RepID=A0AAN8JNM7_PATCE